VSRWKKCEVATCVRPALKNGLCGAHWHRVRRYGELRPEEPIRPRTCGAHHGRLVRGGDLRPEVPIKWRPSGYKKLTISVNNGNNGNPKS